MMKILFLFNSMYFISVSFGANVYTQHLSPEASSLSLNKSGIAPSVGSMKNKQISQLLGRKLTLKEKLGLQLLRWRLSGPDPEAKIVSTPKGRTAKVMGIIALVGLLVFPLATLVCGIIAVVMGSQAKRDNPNDKDARDGWLMGIIALSALVVAILLLVAYVASLYGR